MICDCFVSGLLNATAWLGPTLFPTGQAALRPAVRRSMRSSVRPLTPHMHTISACVQRTMTTLLCSLALFTVQCPYLKRPSPSMQEEQLSETEPTFPGPVQLFDLGEILKSHPVMSRFQDEVLNSHGDAQLQKRFTCKQYYESHKVPHSSVDKESACTAGDLHSIPGLERYPGEGNGNPLQYSCLEKPMDRGA